MSVAITVPDLGTSLGRMSLWFVQTGERVHEGDRVVELVIPGAVIDVSAPVTGIMTDRQVQPGDSVAAGVVLGTIEPDEW